MCAIDQNRGRSKIVTVDGPFGELLEHPDPLGIGNVFQSQSQPTQWEIETLLSRHKCESCANTRWMVVSIGTTNTETCVTTRCAACVNPLHFIYASTKPVISGDVVILVRSQPLNELRTHLVDTKCRCGGVFAARYSLDWLNALPQQIVPFPMQCDSCELVVNLILWDKPEHYFDYSVEIAKSVESAPMARLVLLIAALESYLQKAFVIQNSFNFHLVKTRKVVFQIKEAREVYKQVFACDLFELAGESNWQLLVEATLARNAIIHNAGLDKQHQRLDIGSAYVAEVERVICQFVQSLGDVLRHSGTL